MPKKLFVGNLPFSTTEDELRDLFAIHGAVESVKIVRDQASGRSRGFGFVELEDPDAATKAREAIDGSELAGRTLKVDEAHGRPSEGRGAERRL